MKNKPGLKAGGASKRWPPLEERFWAKVNKASGLGRDGDCWEWIGCKIKGGYGVTSRQNKHILTHRLSFELANGGIIGDKDVCHSCDNPSCVNPLHLFAGTTQENMIDMWSKGRGVSAPGQKTHCKRGHEFNEGNTRTTPQRGRDCRICCALRAGDMRFKKRQRLLDDMVTNYPIL